MAKANKIKRIEIIGNRAIEEDLFDRFKKNEAIDYYTKIPIVHGVGSCGPRQGDHIWPEENFMIVIYCDDKKAKLIHKTVKETKSYFPNEGLKLFEIEVVSTE